MPLDFDWPLGVPWQGFVRPDRPDPPDCPECDGSGSTAAREWVSAICRLIVAAGEDLDRQARGLPLHPWLDGLGPIHTTRRPSAEIGELVSGLGGPPVWSVVGKLIDAARQPADWGECPSCGGSGAVEEYPGQAAEAEAWQRTDPPAGDGWQLWETVSEGSPVSPVFPARDGLIGWLCSPAYTWGASGPLTREQAERFVDVGWAPTFVYSAATGLVPGEADAGPRP